MVAEPVPQRAARHLEFQFVDRADAGPDAGAGLPHRPGRRWARSAAVRHRLVVLPARVESRRLPVAEGRCSMAWAWPTPTRKRSSPATSSGCPVGRGLPPPPRLRRTVGRVGLAAPRVGIQCPPLVHRGTAWQRRKRSRRRRRARPPNPLAEADRQEDQHQEDGKEGCEEGRQEISQEESRRKPPANPLFAPVKGAERRDIGHVQLEVGAPARRASSA